MKLSKLQLRKPRPPKARHLGEDLARGAEIGLFLQELLHSAAVTVGVSAAFLLSTQIMRWLAEHETEIEVIAEHVAKEVV